MLIHLFLLKCMPPFLFCCCLIFKKVKTEYQLLDLFSPWALGLSNLYEHLHFMIYRSRFYSVRLCHESIEYTAPNRTKSVYRSLFRLSYDRILLPVILELSLIRPAFTTHTIRESKAVRKPCKVTNNKRDSIRLHQNKL